LAHLALSERSETKLGALLKAARQENIPLSPGSPLLHFCGGYSDATEQYRIIRTKIWNHPARPSVLLVSSPMAADGKTSAALNLAAALSLQEGVPVLFLDGDFRHTAASRYLGVKQAPGLSEVLRQEARLEAALIRVTEFPNLCILPPGVTTHNPAELLLTAQWNLLTEVFRSEFRFVVIDGPPVGSVAEYELLQLASDGVILIVRQESTNRQLCRRALAAIPTQMRLGVILNSVEEWSFWKTRS
jgi:capsular exopolysaccharide synthesis family protein